MAFGMKPLLILAGVCGVFSKHFDYFSTKKECEASEDVKVDGKTIKTFFDCSWPDKGNYGKGYNTDNFARTRCYAAAKKGDGVGYNRAGKVTVTGGLLPGSKTTTHYCMSCYLYDSPDLVLMAAETAE